MKRVFTVVDSGGEETEASTLHSKEPNANLARPDLQATLDGQHGLRFNAPRKNVETKSRRL